MSRCAAGLPMSLGVQVCRCGGSAGLPMSWGLQMCRVARCVGPLVRGSGLPGRQVRGSVGPWVHGSGFRVGGLAGPWVRVQGWRGLNAAGPPKTPDSDAFADRHVSSAYTSNSGAYGRFSRHRAAAPLWSSRCVALALRKARARPVVVLEHERRLHVVFQSVPHSGHDGRNRAKC